MNDVYMGELARIARKLSKPLAGLLLRDQPFEYSFLVKTKLSKNPAGIIVRRPDASILTPAQKSLILGKLNEHIASQNLPVAISIEEHYEAEKTRGIFLALRAREVPLEKSVSELWNMIGKSYGNYLEITQKKGIKSALRKLAGHPEYDGLYARPDSLYIKSPKVVSDHVRKQWINLANKLIRKHYLPAELLSAEALGSTELVLRFKDKPLS